MEVMDHMHNKREEELKKMTTRENMPMEEFFRRQEIT